MYLGIDVGASKTLLGEFDKAGNLLHKVRFATPDSETVFLHQLQIAWQALGTRRLKRVGLGLPCSIDYANNRVLSCHNIDWLTPTLPLRIEQQFKTPLSLANDTLLAGWCEAALGAGVGSRSLLYVTLSTGIGTSLMTSGAPDPNWLNSEGGQMVIQGEDHAFRRFEELVSGPALKDRFGRYAFEISEPPIWDAIARDMATGLFNMITLVQPQLVVIGGGLAMHFDAYRSALIKYLEQLNPGLYPTPPLKVAHHIETAGLYGAYLLASRGLK